MLTCSSEVVRSHWDKDKNLAENFKDFGLVVDPNAHALKTRSRTVHDRLQLAEKVDLNPSDPIAAVAAAPQKPVAKTAIVEGEQCLMVTVFTPCRA